MPYKLAHEAVEDGMKVSTESQFAVELRRLFERTRPTKIIETGTYMGMGTTAMIGAALAACAIAQPEFYSIEVNRAHFMAAHQNVQRQRINVQLMLGLSVPRSLLPTRQEIQRQYVHNQVDGVYVDFDPATRVEQYYRETDFGDLPDDLLGKCLDRFQGRPDFVLLDSAGHMGFVEFQYLMGRVQGPFALALDDVNHVKHYQSLQALKQDPRFQILVESKEKFGFCMAQFTPG